LIISEGYPAFTTPDVSNLTPDNTHGRMSFSGLSATWVRGMLDPASLKGNTLVASSGAWLDNDSMRFGWFIDGSEGSFIGRTHRLSYTLSSNGLSLAEPVRIAESVPLP